MAKSDFDRFANSYKAGKSQILSLEYIADLETPVSVYLKLAQTNPYSFLLESVEGGAIKGRYSIIGTDPDLIWRCDIGGVSQQILNGNDARTEVISEPPITALRHVVEASKIDERGNLPPAVSALVGYLGYDMISHIENLEFENPDTLELPDALLMRPTLIVVFDNIKDSLSVLVPVRPLPGLSAEDAFERANEKIEQALSKLLNPMALHPEPSHFGHEPSEAVASNTAPEHYMKKVKQAQDYILAGDIFQVVLSQRFSMPFPLSGLALYRSLRRLNPSPFLFLLNLGDFSVVGSSPEILVRLRDSQVTIRPIAGTRPRGKTALEDKQLADDLLNDPKELAEHLMLLDLGRNDVGRVAKPGSVMVTEKNTIEYYSHVMHIVSNVIGEIAEGEDAISALFAGFPAGTVSGAPKIRAMEIIEELESEKRGVYAGAVGYFGADGSMDSCIALRTAVLKNGRLFIQAGAGIVADSNPLSEQKECEAKSGALVAAAKDAIAIARSNS